MTQADAATAIRTNRDGIYIHSAEAFDGMRAAGRLAAEILDEIGPHVVPGVSTAALDQIIQDRIEAAGATSATIGYKGYQHASCISINHVVCHGIPGPKVLRDGDVLNVDVTVIVDGWYGDTSRMYWAGKLSRKAERLIQITHDSLMEGIAAVKPGNTFEHIGYVIQSYAEALRCSVVRDFCGHGLGRQFHSAPNVLHYGRSPEVLEKKKIRGVVLEPGMFFTIEPMVNLGRPETKILSDEWTAVTRDRSLSAQYEHSIGVTEDGCEIFTLSPANVYAPDFSA